MIAEEKVYKIEKKKYLGQKDLTEFDVPSGITEIEDWAFAQCENLRIVRLPGTLKKVGKQIFDDCPQLKDIMVASMPIKMSRLLAYAFLNLDFVYDYDYSCGKPSEWLELFDEELNFYLDTPDDVKFTPFLAGGEEDYQDVEEARLAHMELCKKDKSCMILERLILQNEFSLYDKNKEKYCNYLKKELDITLNALIQENTKSLQYYKILKDRKLINKLERERLLTLLDERHVELKALILHEKSILSFEWDNFQL